MAIRTSIGTGPWSAPGTWDTGVPLNGDSAVIALGHVVTFDVDQSGFASGLVGLTITGELTASTSAGAYYLKMAAHITGTGKLSAGSSGTPYPSTCTFTILLNGAFALGNNTALDVQLFCTQPVVNYVKLSGVEAAGQTALSVDTDVTASPGWAANAVVRIDDINQTVDSEERTIQSLTATEITITAGLTAQKETGAYVHLISRNIKVIGVGTGNGVYSSKVGCTLRCEIRTHVYGVIYGSGHTISGTVSGCSNGVIYGSGHTISGTVSGCTYGVNSGSGHTFLAPTFQSNTQDLYAVVDARGWNTLFGSAVEFASYNTNERPAAAYVESLDHDRVANAFKAWCRGGIVTSVATPVYGTRSVSYQHACESASYPVFMQRAVMIEPNGWLFVRAWLRKNASMSAYLPRIWIVDPFANPLHDIANPPLAEATMTNVNDTWEELRVQWQNTGSTPKPVLVMSLAKAASGILYADFEAALFTGKDDFVLADPYAIRAVAAGAKETYERYYRL